MDKTKSVKAFVTTRRMTDINRYTSNERLCTRGMVLVLPTGKSDRGESISALSGSGTLYEGLSTKDGTLLYHGRQPAYAHNGKLLQQTGARKQRH
jgi:hypothetical protein